MLLLLALPALAGTTTDTVRFAVVGDTQTDGDDFAINDDVFPQLVEDIETLDPDVFIVAGDLVGGSSSLDTTVEQWGDFLAAVAATDAQVLVVPGNHDVYGGAGTFEAWRETFDWLPQDDSPVGEEGVSYYVDVGTTRFVFITSDHPSNSYNVSSAGLVWLDGVLADSGDFDQVFVTTHHPISFSTEGGLGTTNSDFWQTLVTYDVTGMFSGHWHRYQPGQITANSETWETIIGTGGGWQGFSPIRPYQQVPGFLLVEVEGTEAVATFYGDDDGDGHYLEPLDSYTMRSATPAVTGLVAGYDFEDGAGTDMATSPPGRGIDGVLSGDATTASGGPMGRHLVLDGNDDFMVAGAIDSYSHAILDDLTLSAWVRVDDHRSGEWSNNILCFATNDYYSEDEETNYAYWLNIEGDGRLRMFWEYGNGSNVSVFSDGDAGMADGAWHHVAAIRDTTAGTVQFRVDGKSVGEAVAYDRLPSGASRGMLYLGSDTEGSGYELVGALDEVCIFDEVLDDDQLEALAGKAGCEEVIDSGGGTDTGDGGATDGGATDGGATDGGTSDGGTTDGGTNDGGTTDGAATDGGTADGGTADGGNSDGGTPGDGGATGDPKDEGCGCAGPAAPAWLWLALAPFLLRRRR